MERSSFFNSINKDRRYKASDFAEYFNSLLTNGVFPNPSTNLQVIANNNMTVTIKAGKAWINGYVYILDADMILPIEIADGVLKRIDRIVIQFNTIGRSINAVVVKGTFASSPYAPELFRNADLYELGIADISISNGATSISQANITDLRMNTTYCGWVNSLIQADTTAIFNQYLDWLATKQTAYDGDFITWTTSKKSAYDTWYNNMVATEQNQIDNIESQFQSDFDIWFSNVKNQLGTDAAGNLQNQVTINTNNIARLNNEIGIYQVATGTATEIQVIATLTNGCAKTFIASANNNASTTTINGLPFYKPGTTTAPTLIKGKAYTAWYNLEGNCFFIKASAEGTATKAQVLAGVPFSNEDDTGLIGTLDLSKLVASNIRKDVTINGVTGDKLKYSIGDVIPANSVDSSYLDYVQMDFGTETILSILPSVNNDFVFVITSLACYKVSLEGVILAKLTSTTATITSFSSLATICEDSIYLYGGTPNKIIRCDLNLNVLISVAVVTMLSMAVYSDGLHWSVGGNNGGWIRKYNRFTLVLVWEKMYNTGQMDRKSFYVDSTGIICRYVYGAHYAVEKLSLTTGEEIVYREDGISTIAQLGYSAFYSGYYYMNNVSNPGAVYLIDKSSLMIQTSIAADNRWTYWVSFAQDGDYSYNSSSDNLIIVSGGGFKTTFESPKSVGLGHWSAMHRGKCFALTASSKVLYIVDKVKKYKLL